MTAASQDGDMSSSIGVTAAELRQVALGARDATGYFAAMYARVTRGIAAGIERGQFVDGERMDRFATTFADHYVRALRSAERRPRCWTAPFDVAADQRLLIVQHLVLGINAHVNHDLALAVVSVADEDGDLRSIRPDFDAVNDTLAAVYDDLLGDLDRVSRWVAPAAGAGGGHVFNFSLRRARAQAWGAAERLYPLGEAERRAYALDLDQLVSVLAYLVTRPPLSLRPALWMARRLEERDHAKVVSALLGEE
jgi:hypothetical protein